MLSGVAATGQPAVRWYVAAAPALIIGSGQRLRDIDSAACRAAGVPVYRRASGGSAVLCVPGLLMQDIVLPHAHPLRIDDVSESYHWLGSLWATTLAACEIAVQPVGIAEAHSDTHALDPLLRRVCFGGRSPYELLAGERKLVGFAQVRRRSGVLFQVGLYTTWPGEALAELLALNEMERLDLVGRLGKRVAGLADLQQPPPSHATLMAAFATALAREHAVVLTPSPWQPSELEAMEQARPRFAPLALAAT